MSGVHGQVFGHLVRRGMSAAQVHLNEAGNPGGEHEKEVVINFDPQEYLPAMIIFLITALLYASVRYTLGEVVASLAMIESPSSTATIESRPQKYADEPDAPLEKEKEAMMMPAEATADQDVEITVINHKPISAKISTSIRHLHNVGGFFGRWRGAGVCAVYHFLHGLSTNLLSNLMGFGIAGHALTHIFTTVCLARLHMAWTHAMIAAPKSDNKIWFRRMVPRKQCKALLLPSLACAVAQQITIIMPIGVAFAFGLPDQVHNQEFDFMNRDIAPSEASYYAFALLAVPLTAVFVALAILLPASVTLTRIEAALLPEDQDTIVPFDKSAILGDFDLQARGACRKIFVEAWKSFEPAARLRLIKLYVKMASIQVFIVVMGFVAAMFLM